MIDPLLNHLWQSTVCALAAALLTLAFRKNGDSSVPLALIVWRSVNYPRHTPKSLSDSTQPGLAKIGFSNFVSAETSIGSRRVHTLDFDKALPDGSLLSCRHYFIADGRVRYVLGFGTSKRDAMFDTFDRVAKSFAFEKF